MEKELYGYIVNSDGFVWNKKHTQSLKGKIDKDGYRTLILLVDGKRKSVREHRLVAMCFVENPNPEKYSIVNHIDGNKLNNNAKNLEWTDDSGNMIHAIKKGLYKTPDTSKKTIILNTLTNEILEFKSRKECEEYYGAEFRCICGSRQCKRFKHLREVMPDAKNKLTNKEKIV